VPIYIDRHSLATIPSAIQQRMHREAMRGSVDQHGVQPLGHWVTDRAIYCVLRAPSEEAARRHHAERGLPRDELRPVTGLRDSPPLEAKEAQIVRAVLNRWPINGVAAERRAVRLHGVHDEEHQAGLAGSPSAGY
jgi:Protein of unknown function (DUF4242)